MFSTTANHIGRARVQRIAPSANGTVHYCANWTTLIRSGSLQGEGAERSGFDEDADSAATEAFRVELEALIPQLRAFARSLCGNRDVADDLVQDAMLKAWAARERYEPGTNMRAWVFIIMRNVFLSQKRRDRFKGEWNDEVADRALSTAASQEKQLQLADVQRALGQLPPAQREALVLVGAGGLAYEEAAEICGCAVGTVKSRVARARAALQAIIDSDSCRPRSAAAVGAERAGEAILSEVARIVG